MRRTCLALIQDGNSGAAYVPFIGDGDLAAATYPERTIYGVDLDPDRVATAGPRFANGVIKPGNCEEGWPFPDVQDVFAVCDADAYSYPYGALRAFWKHALKADVVALFGTDGQMSMFGQSGTYRSPDGKSVRTKKGGERSKVSSGYWTRIVKPWIIQLVEADGYHVVMVKQFKRAQMLYWGMVVSKGETDLETVTEPALAEVPEAGKPVSDPSDYVASDFIYPIDDRKPAESTTAYHAFVHYRDLAPYNRSIDAAFFEHAKDCEPHRPVGKRAARRWYSWSSQYEWTARAGVHDAELSSRRREKRAKALDEAQDRLAEIAEKALRRATERLESMDAEEIAASVIPQWIKVPGELQLKALGYEERVAVSGPDGGPVQVEQTVDFAKLLADPETRKALETLGLSLEAE